MTFHGICREGRTQDVTDLATVCVKLVTPLEGTVEFLTHLGDFFRNFGIHLRGETGVEIYLCRSANLSTGCYKIP